MTFNKGGRMRNRIALGLILLPLLALEVACVGTRPALRRTNSALDFLYPEGAVGARPASQVVLRLPVRVGLAFAPNRHRQPDPITEGEKQTLLAEVAAAFEAHEGIGHLEVVPSAYLQPGGGFPNLDQLHASLGLDLMVLVSYDQAQFTESTRASWTYLTIVGPLLIQGEKNDTRTVMDAVIYDIRSRALLFRAAGESTVNGRSSPVNVDRKRRRFASAGFDKATDQLIANLNRALARFEEQAAAGTVQGPGTPAVALYNAQGERVTPGSGGGGGGALGGAELFTAVLLGLALLLGARRI
jgi:rhombotail lipoprotein